MAESPWPIDSTPDNMSYVLVCPTCHGVTFTCSTERAPMNSDALTSGLRRGHTFYRVPSTVVQQRDTWHYCRCHLKVVPHAC